MIKAVIFDLDDTLYDTTLQVDKARENAVKAMVAAGLQTEEEKAAAALAEVVSKKGSNYENHYDDLLNALGCENNPKIIAAGVVAYHEAKKTYLVPYPGTIPTLLKLREKGLRIGIVTDGRPVKQWEKLIRLGLADFFDAVVVSDGHEQKPSPKPFLKAASELGVRPSECVIVGDRLDRDISGGKKAGMRAIQLTRGKHSRMKPADAHEEPDCIVSTIGDVLHAIQTL
jgi:putative hydrolase of the HAD superfamily